MPFQRFIPALSTIGVIAGLAAARMLIEVVPFGRAAEVVSGWVHETPERAMEPAPESALAAKPERAGPAKRVVSVMTIEGSLEVQPPLLVPVPSGAPDPSERGTTPNLPDARNGTVPRASHERWIGA